MSRFNILRKKTQPSTDVAGSILYDEGGFYNKLTQDLMDLKCLRQWCRGFFVEPLDC